MVIEVGASPRVDMFRAGLYRADGKPANRKALPGEDSYFPLVTSLFDSGVSLNQIIQKQIKIREKVLKIFFFV